MKLIKNNPASISACREWNMTAEKKNDGSGLDHQSMNNNDGRKKLNTDSLC